MFDTGSISRARRQVLAILSISLSNDDRQNPITCQVCADAFHMDSKNKRCNPSALLRHDGVNILIDCGKSFRPAMLRVLRHHRIERIDAVLLTHAHADAAFGLDDLREWLLGPRGSETPIPVFVRDSGA